MQPPPHANVTSAVAHREVLAVGGLLVSPYTRVSPRQLLWVNSECKSILTQEGR